VLVPFAVSSRVSCTWARSSTHGDLACRGLAISCWGSLPHGSLLGRRKAPVIGLAQGAPVQIATQSGIARNPDATGDQLEVRNLDWSSCSLISPAPPSPLFGRASSSRDPFAGPGFRLPCGGFENVPVASVNVTGNWLAARAPFRIGLTASAWALRTVLGWLLHGRGNQILSPNLARVILTGSARPASFETRRAMSTPPLKASSSR
jgi:hypothetical protein